MASLFPTKFRSALKFQGETRVPAGFVECPECEGYGRVLVGIHGPNDPDCRGTECLACDGCGEVEIEAPEEGEGD